MRTSSTPPPAYHDDIPDIHVGSDSTRNRIRALLFKLKKTETDRDEAKAEARGFKYKYERMKGKAQEMATINGGLMTSNGQLINRVKVLENMHNPFSAPYPQNMAMMTPRAPVFPQAQTFPQHIPRSSTVESIEVPNWIHG